MTVFDLRCDRCATLLAGPGGEDGPEGPFGIRFMYHPGDPLLRDDAGLLCRACWRDVVGGLDPARPEGRCAACGRPVARTQSLHLHPAGDPYGWQLCPEHAAAFLNSLRTVEPKFDPRTFTLPARRPEPPAS